MKNVTILLAVVAMLAVTAHAAPTPTVHEPFNYTAGAYLGGDAYGVGACGGTTEIGLSGVWKRTYGDPYTTISATGPAYPTGSPLVGVGGSAERTTTHLTRHHRQLTNSISMDTGDTFYMSMLFNLTARTANSYALIGLSTADNEDPNLRFGFERIGYGDLAFYLEGPGGDAVTYGNTPEGDFPVTFLLVVKVVTSAAGNDVATLKTYKTGVDTVGAEPVAWDLTSTSASSDTLTHLCFKDQSIQGKFDEFRMGDTWEDVTGVPEPATMVLLGIGGIGVLLRRRRK